jgi:DnaJ family protein B protein 4
MDEIISRVIAIGSKDYYAVLDVGVQASEEDIRREWKRACRAAHPDKNPHRNEEATQAQQVLNNAVETLTNRDKRLKYDADRERQLSKRQRDDQGRRRARKARKNATR